MFHSLKRFWLAFVVFAVVGVPTAFGFALIGPFNEAFQVNVIGYNLNGPSAGLGNQGGGADIGAPKNLAQGYRWNIPTLFYACDATFLSYFGSNGLAAVDSAYAVLNSLTNVSSYTTNLSEWPLDSTGPPNYTAQALNLIDIKSATLSLMMEQLGLAQPDRWVWCLHDRFTAGLTCPNFVYSVIQRNYDPYTRIYSSYVNGTLYDYDIIELCTFSPAIFPPLEADAIEFTPDPTTSYTAVAAFGAEEVFGTYYNGLTRDDVGGLRYLYSSTNKFEEPAGTNSVLLYTNKAAYTNIISTNLAQFLSQALTNNQAALQALYPNLAITSVTNIFTNVVTTNITAFFTNPPLGPAGSAVVVLTTNFTTNVANEFAYTFGNLKTNHFYTKGYITTLTTNVAFTTSPFGPAGGGTLKTNVTKKTVLVTNYFNGDFFILPPGWFGYQIVSTQLVSVIPVTNVVVIATNSPGVTNLNGQSFTLDIITYFTNYSYNVYPIQFVTNSVDLREGCEKINYVRRDFDSLLGTFWAPITNFYSLTAVTNGAPLKQTFLRVVTQPDILFQAADLSGGPSGPPVINIDARSTPNYNTSLVPANQGGPGILGPPVSFTFNKVGPIAINFSQFFINEGVVIFPTPAHGSVSSTNTFQWASFDGSTNAPIVYPDTISIDSLESQVFFQILGTLLPVGSVSVNDASNPYVAPLQAQGASPPFTWAMAPGSPTLPNGLNLSSDGVISGALTGASVGTYDFTVQATDSTGRVAQSQLFIEVDP